MDPYNSLLGSNTCAYLHPFAVSAGQPIKLFMAQAHYEQCPDVRRVPAKRIALGFPACPAHGFPLPSAAAVAATLNTLAGGGYQGVLLASMRERDDPLSDQRPTQYDLAVVQYSPAGQPLQVEP